MLKATTNSDLTYKLKRKKKNYGFELDRRQNKLRLDEGYYHLTTLMSADQIRRGLGRGDLQRIVVVDN